MLQCLNNERINKIKVAATNSSLQKIGQSLTMELRGGCKNFRTGGGVPPRVREGMWYQLFFIFIIQFDKLLNDKFSCYVVRGVWLYICIAKLRNEKVDKLTKSII